MTNVTVYDEVFNDVYIPYLTNYSRIQIFYGGSSSGKSVFLAQRCVYDLMQGGRNYLVCRKIAQTIRRSVFAEIEKVINDWGVKALFKVNHSEFVITCTNGYQILFAGLDDVEKIKSITPIQGVLTDIWVEEATECTDRDIRQLLKRQRGGSASTKKRLTMSFNPILQTHWIYSLYFSRAGWADTQTQYQDDRMCILKTWYIHNRFLTEDDVRDLEDESDKYFYQVYTLGNWGILGNVIFTNWRVDDLSAIHDQFTNRRAGLDFGFADDPAAAGNMHYDRKRKTIYIFEELYERGLTNDVLAGEIKKLLGGEPYRKGLADNLPEDELKKLESNDYIVCDSAEPKSIAELKRFGIRARSAKKGKDSVNFGIQWLQRQTIIVDVKAIHAQNELSFYHWKEDREGNLMKVPVDKFNHFIDQMRYAFEDDMADRSSAADMVAFAG